jgi:hypothetical protein
MGMMRMVEIHDPVRPVASSAQEGAAGGHAGHGVRH